MATPISKMRLQETARFAELTLDYLVENGIGGDIHVYGCNRGDFLQVAVDVADAAFPGANFKFVGFAPPTVQAVPKGRGGRDLCTFGAPTDLERLGANGRVRIMAAPYSESLTLANQKHFLDEENKVALACLRAGDPKEARLVLDFVEPLLTEGSVVLLEDLFAGYRRTPAKDVGRAFLDHFPRSRFRFASFLSVGWWGRAYVACLPTELPIAEL